jgi:hypothetical protein
MLASLLSITPPPTGEASALLLLPQLRLLDDLVLVKAERGLPALTPAFW